MVCQDRRNLWIVLGFLALFGHTSASMAQVVGYVDTRWLLLAHPTFRTLSAKDRRFAGTTSRTTDLAGEKKRLEAELTGISNQLAAASGSFRTDYSRAATPEARRAVEQSYWQKRQELEGRKKELDERRLVLQRAVPDPDGSAVPPSDALIGPIKQIQADIEAAIRSVAAKRHCSAIFDLAALREAVPEAPELSVLHTTPHAELFRGQPSQQTIDALPNWLTQARRYWHRRAPESCGLPFRAGCLDLRRDALQELLAANRPQRR